MPTRLPSGYLTRHAARRVPWPGQRIAWFVLMVVALVLICVARGIHSVAARIDLGPLD